MLIIHLKTELSKKNLLTNIDKVLVSLSLIIGWFILVLKLTKLYIKCWV